MQAGRLVRELVASVFLLSFGCRSEMNVRPAELPEEVVYAESEDGFVNAGILFSPRPEEAKPETIVWVHGWGVNFYCPTYVAVGRALAERGYTCLSVNTRMHDIGNVLGYRRGRRIRGGGYWGVASEQIRDLAGWSAFAEKRGLRRLILVGHSAGWAAVREYQFRREDPRVVGLVLASGMVWAKREAPDPDLLAQARRLVQNGYGDDLLRLPNRSFPSFVSAATFLDTYETPDELYDFFGVETDQAGVTRIRCPILAFFGTDGDVGGEEDLELLKAAVGRHSSGPPSVSVTMIEGADHMYVGQEDQVAETISRWWQGLPADQAATREDALE